MKRSFFYIWTGLNSVQAVCYLRSIIKSKTLVLKEENIFFTDISLEQLEENQDLKIHPNHAQSKYTWSIRSIYSNARFLNLDNHFTNLLQIVTEKILVYKPIDYVYHQGKKRSLLLDLARVRQLEWLNHALRLWTKLKVGSLQTRPSLRQGEKGTEKSGLLNLAANWRFNSSEKRRYH